MKCDETLPLMDVYLDGELDVEQHAAFDAHLRGCAECRSRAKAIAERNSALRTAVPRYEASEAFRRRILDSLDERGAGAPVSARVRGTRFYWNAWGAAAGLAAAVLLGYSWGSVKGHGEGLLDEAIADHVRSLQAGHLLDVVSTDQHTVKPWFSGKLDFAPPVTDLAAAGYPLAGGRMERLDGQTAAALVFHRGLHSINLFVWPAARGGVQEGLGGRNGFQSVSWTKGDLNFMAVSDIPSADLQRFSEDFRDQTR